VSRLLRSIVAAPAVRAGAIQLLSFPLTLLAVYTLARAGGAPGYASAALVQGAFAAVLSWRAGLAPWWWPIQFLFPVLLLFAQSPAVSPWVYLGCFGFLLALYWSTFRTQVPYYPSGRRVWAAVAELLAPDRPLAIADVGSGLGGLVLHLSKVRPDCAVTGIELAPLPWLVSRVRAARAPGHHKFVRADYHGFDFGSFDVVFAYLSPAVMPALWHKARAEMRPGSMLLSYEFVIPDHPPDVSVTPTDRGPAIYVWHF